MIDLVYMKVMPRPACAMAPRSVSYATVIIVVSLLLCCLMSGCDRHPEKSAVIDMSERIHTARTPARQAADPLRIAVAAVVSPKETAVYYDEMMRYVSRRIGRPVEIVQRKTYQEVNDLLEHRELDVAFVCSGPYVSGRKKFGMELLVAPMLYGKAFYQAYFIVPEGSPVTDLAGLRGKRFALTDPNSNTGSLVPTYVLSSMGETPESFFSSYIYTYSHDNSIRAVAKRMVDGASVDGLIWEYYHEKQPGIVKNTRIIFRSPLYGIPPVVVHPRTPAPMKDKLRRIFLDMHSDPEGKRILDGLRIERFIIPEDRSYDSVREMQRWLGRRG